MHGGDDRQSKFAPVIDEGKLIGIIPIGDLVKNIIRTYLKIV